MNPESPPLDHDPIAEFKLKCEAEIREPIRASDFKKLRWYIAQHGGFSSDTVPLERILYHRKKILEKMK